MAKWAVGWGLLGGCVLCLTGCGKPEPGAEVTRLTGPAPVQTLDVVELPELAASSTGTRQAGPPAEHLAREVDAEPPPSRLLETDSESRERPAGRSFLDDEERIGFLEAAEAARTGNTNISATAPTEEVTIATGTVDGRVKRVRPGTIEVSDDEGNIYELRIDGRSRGLRRGRHIPLGNIPAGTPVRASFDLVGGGESLARDILLRR